MNRDNDTPSIEYGRKLFAGECQFVAGAASVASLPPPGLPEIALAGRSNVGKSSLLNAITRRKSLARVSRTPGATQQINFFSVTNRLLLADLPGYGFAKASKQKIGAWSDLIYKYLSGRATLRRVMTLVDVRRGLGDSDNELLDFLDQTGLSYQVVLTKADEEPPAKVAQIVGETAAALARRAAAHPRVLAVSAEKGDGLAELRAEIAAFALPAR
jgi:GTP-binding protein